MCSDTCQQRLLYKSDDDDGDEDDDDDTLPLWFLSAAIFRDPHNRILLTIFKRDLNLPESKFFAEGRCAVMIASTLRSHVIYQYITSLRSIKITNFLLIFVILRFKIIVIIRRSSSLLSVSFNSRFFLKINSSIKPLSLHKKWNVPLRIYSVNVTKSVRTCGFGHIYWKSH